MAAMCSESKPWSLRSLSFLLLVSYMTLARLTRLESLARPYHSSEWPYRGACGRARLLIVLRSDS